MSIKKTIYVLILAIVLGLPNPSMAWIVGDSSYYISQIIHGRVSRPMFTLVVTGSGGGNGTITSDIYGVNCTSTAGVESGVCLVQIPAGTTVILTATPSLGFMFNGWTGGGCTVGTCTVLMDGNKTIDASFDVGPWGDYLIGYYKFNEGGATVFNRATNGILGGGLLPNLTVLNGRGDFWTAMPGFGDVNERGVVAPPTYAFFDKGVGGAYNATGACHGMFFYLTSGLNWKGLFWAHSYDMYNTAFAYVGGQFIGSTDTNDWSTKAGYYNLDGLSANGAVDSDLVVDQWYLGFQSSDFGACWVKTNGTIRCYAMAGISAVTTLRVLYVGGGTAFSFGGAFGDLIIYNNIILTRAEWASWYDLLRGRYGMGARVGW